MTSHTLDAEGLEAALEGYVLRLPFGLRDGAKGADALKVALGDAIRAYLDRASTSHEGLAKALEPTDEDFRLVRNIKWASADRDNMEFSTKVSCYQREALERVVALAAYRHNETWEKVE